MSTYDAVSRDVGKLSLDDTTQGTRKPFSPFNYVPYAPDPKGKLKPSSSVPSSTSFKYLDKKGTRNPPIASYEPNPCSSKILNPADVFYLPSLSRNDLPCNTRPEPHFLPPGEWVVTPRSTSLDPKNDVVWIEKGYEGAFDQTLVFDEGPCPACAGEHPRCDVCYKFHHYERCPYFILLPRGAHFNPRYEVICDCGNLFNEDKWFCTSCFGKTAVLSPKPDCVICGDISHMKHECPVDKPGAAFYRLLREKQLNGCDEQKQIPWNPTESELDAMRLILSS